MIKIYNRPPKDQSGYAFCQYKNIKFSLWYLYIDDVEKRIPIDKLELRISENKKHYYVYDRKRGWYPVTGNFSKRDAQTLIHCLSTGHWHDSSKVRNKWIHL